MRTTLFFRLFLLCFFPLFLAAKPPQITPKEVKAKIEEILKAHASYKKITPELVQRSLENFIEELDPSKTYLLAPELAIWLQPDEQMKSEILEGIDRCNFSQFEKIHSLFVASIERRALLEKKANERPLPTGVKSEEFKELSWAQTEEELEDRILRIRALQLEAAQKLGEENREKFIQRLAKRRLNKEAELVGINQAERFKNTLAYFLKAAASALDGHTNYFTPSEANQFTIQVQQRLFGIGAQLRDDLDGLSVIRIFENSPASGANKLKINDKIIAVNHEPIVGMDIAEAVELIRGEKGSIVKLTILRQGQEEKEGMEIELVRNEIVLEETRLESSLEPYGDGVIAYLKLFSFYQDQKSSSSGDIRKALELAKKEANLKGVVLDLRGNAGGILTQAVGVSGLFMNKGVVCSIKDNTSRIQRLREVEGRPVWEGPLLILTNRASASAAEIVAQALQDYGRALVVGDDRTFGKGSFQTFTLDTFHNAKINPQGEYKVTRGRYYTVSGKSPQLKGVQANIVVPGILSDMEIGEQFSKFPLENDQIDPQFNDDLSDLSLMHQIELRPLYNYNLQSIKTTYAPYLESLKKNSEERIKQNKNYQNFLTELKNKNYEAESIHLFGQSDLQLTESINVMKDLILFMQSEKNLEDKIAI